MAELNINTKIELTYGDDILVIDSEDGTYEIDDCSISLKDSTSSTFSFELHGIDDPTLLSRFPENATKVKIYKGPYGNETHLITGTLRTKPCLYDNGLYQYTFDGPDYVAYMQTILVNEAYENQTISYIVNDLHSKYLAQYCPIDVIDQTDIRITAKFKDKYLFDVLERLAEMLFWSFTITQDTKFKFYDPKTVSNVNILTVNNVEHPIHFSTDTSRLVNRLRVQGPNKPSMDQTKIWTADGQTTIFNYPVKKVLASEVGKLLFYVDDVLTTIGTKYLQNYTETIKYLFNTNDAAIETETPPPEGTVLKSIYQYQYPLIFYLDDKISQQKYGVVTKKIRVDSIDDISSQIEARTYLNRFSMPIKRATLKPIEGFYFPGQLINLDMPEIEMTGMFKIQSVQYNGVYENDITIEVEGGF